jgi:hypothetical protein
VDLENQYLLVDQSLLENLYLPVDLEDLYLPVDLENQCLPWHR